LHQLAIRPRAEAGAAPLSDALKGVRAIAKRRSLIVVITDLLDSSDWSRQLRALTLRHDVVVVEVRDPREDSLPNVGLLTLVDPESGRRLEVQTASAKLRARFAEAAALKRADQTKAVRGAGAGHLVLSTDRDWLLDVVRYVGAKRRRR
jgi:uncharacterized protein (DUF58 family)